MHQYNWRKQRNLNYKVQNKEVAKPARDAIRLTISNFAVKEMPEDIIQGN